MVYHRIEKTLGAIWVSEKEGLRVGNEIITQTINDNDISNEARDKLLTEINHLGLINIVDHKITLTVKGSNQAESITRRHRLAERLVIDVLDSNTEEYESGKCKFDVYVENDIVSAICTLLGHPKTCPHGNIIPRGHCCVKAKKELKPLITPLSKLHPGSICKTVYIDKRIAGHLDKIVELDIHAGTKVRVHQIDPAFVIQVRESNILIDKHAADHIYVRCEQQ